MTNSQVVHVIDDDDRSRKLAADVLASQGFRVHASGTAAEAQAQLLAHGADLVLLDEPCAGVNPSLVGGISTLLKELNQKRKGSFVVIEHNMDFVMDLCHRIMVMVEGKVLAIGTPDEIRGNKQVLDAYLGN